MLPSISILSEVYYFEIEVNYPPHFRYYEYFSIIFVIGYSLVPAALPITGRGKKVLENYVTEFEILKKLMYFAVPLLIVILLIVALTYQPEKPNVSYILLSGIILIAGATLLRFFSNLLHKDFRFYYARGCLRFMSKESDQTNKFYYFVMAINSYDKYLKRNLKLQINSIDNIYSKIMSDPNIEKCKLIKLVGEAFENNDKLEPIKCMSDFLGIRDTEHFLIKEPIVDKIKGWASFLAVIIPVIISIIQLIRASA
jgi:hypothetical protein